MTSASITFIGGGNMATSLIGGLLAGGYDAHNFHVADPEAAKREALAQRFGVAVSDNNIMAAEDADVVVLAVKPQVLRTVAEALGEGLRTRPLLISIAAGVRTSSMLRWLDDAGWPLVRAMPNTPALIKCGMSGLFATADVSSEQRALAQAILDAAGRTQWVEDEGLMDAITAVSGSGPAYFFLFMEAMQAAAGKLGLDADAARTLVLQTALGAARMADESGEAPAELRRRVTSPGGTTESAVTVFQQGGLEALVSAAVEGALGRARALAQELDTD